MIANPEGTVDLLVVGGGINGAGIACDAAGRGLRVALCEQDDLASATSSAWSAHAFLVDPSPPKSVWTLPGMTVLTRTPSKRRSSIIASLIPSRPNLLAL